jgi:esterase/lipase superfamily enzyme
VEGNQKFSELLKSKSIEHRLILTENAAHTWTLWRVYLHDLLPLLFTADVHP